jgi:hypothetical protein
LDIRVVLAQEFAFLWVTHKHMTDIGAAYEAAAATLHGMAGRLTALTMSHAAGHEHLWAILEAGPQLARALTSLSFSFSHASMVQLHNAADAVLAVSARLQHLALGLGAYGGQFAEYSASEVQAADAVFQHLMRSLPCCQSLCLGACGPLSHQAIGRELLQRGPHLGLVSLTLYTGKFDEHVSTDL